MTAARRKPRKSSKSIGKAAANMVNKTVKHTVRGAKGVGRGVTKMGKDVVRGVTKVGTGIGKAVVKTVGDTTKLVLMPFHVE